MKNSMKSTRLHLCAFPRHNLKSLCHRWRLQWKQLWSLRLSFFWCWHFTFTFVFRNFARLRWVISFMLNHSRWKISFVSNIKTLSFSGQSDDIDAGEPHAVHVLPWNHADADTTWHYRVWLSCACVSRLLFHNRILCVAQLRHRKCLENCRVRIVIGFLKNSTNELLSSLRQWKVQERRWYICNHVYGWSVPCIMTTIVAVKHNLKASLGVTTCWFHRET